MTDRELLELAAKAAGITTYHYRETDGRAFLWRNDQRWGREVWAPLHDDGDALRLAVELQLLVIICHHHTEVRWYDEALSETHTVEQWDNGMQPDEFTRHAIVRAAAEIGMSKA